MNQYIKTPDQINKIRQSGQILKSALNRLREEANIGVTTIELDNLAKEFIEASGGKPAFLGYKPDGAEHPFPYSTCISLHDVIVHGRPSSDKLKDGDVVSFDLGVDYNGGISDSAFTMIIGKKPKDLGKLLFITEKALQDGIKEIKPGNRLGDVGYAIEKTINQGRGYVCDGLGGHGVGIEVHEDPFVFNTGERGTGVELEEGMVLAIEPMASLKTQKIIQLDDDSYATSDGSLSAHFEHTVLVTKNGHEVLT